MYLSITIPDKLFLGDSVTITGTIYTDNDSAQDLTDYKIRASLHNRYASEIKKATSNSGGSTSEIEVTDASAGEFTVYVDKDETDGFDNEIFLEIEVEDDNGLVNTLYSEEHYFHNDGLDWTTSA